MWPITETQWKNEWGAEIITSHGSSNARGVAILIKAGFDCSIHQQILDPMGRYIIVKAVIQDKTYVLINIYAPNKDKDIVNFFKNLFAVLQKENLESEENIIIGGDFNCPLNPELDKKRGGGGVLLQRKSVTNCIKCLQSQLDLVDIWRIKKPDIKSYTWSQKSPRIFCRLDYYLISNNLFDMVRSSEIIPTIKTDHDAIALEIGKLENGQKGPGYWKLNCSLLADDAYVTELLPVWAAEGRKELTDHRSVWDWIKYNIRAHAINFSKRKSKERNEKEKTLQEELSKAKKEFELKCITISSCSGKIGNLLRRKTKGIIIRARVRWHEYGEKSTKYFLNLEKRNHIKKHIRKLFISGVIKTDPFCILKEQEHFYRDLYKSKNNDPEISQKI